MPFDYYENDSLKKFISILGVKKVQEVYGEYVDFESPSYHFSFDKKYFLFFKPLSLWSLVDVFHLNHLFYSYPKILNLDLEVEKIYMHVDYHYSGFVSLNFTIIVDECEFIEDELNGFDFKLNSFSCSAFEKEFLNFFESFEKLKIDSLTDFKKKETQWKLSLNKRKSERMKLKIYKKPIIKINFSIKKNNLVLDITSEDGKYSLKNPMDFKNLSELIGLSNQNNPKIFEFLDIHNPTKVTLHRAKFTSKLELTDFRFECKIRFNIKHMNYIMFEGIYFQEKNAFHFKCNLIEPGCSVIFIETENQITSKNIINYDNSNVENIYFHKNIKNLSFIPKFLLQYPCEIFSTSTYNKSYEIKSQQMSSITLFLSKSCKLLVGCKDHNYDIGFAFPDHYCTFTKDTFGEGKIERKTSDMRILQNFMGTYKIPHQSLKFKHDSGLENRINISNRILKFESGFLEYKGTFGGKPMVFRIPLHQREFPELYVSGSFNSIFDLNHQKGLNVRILLGNASDIKFKFLN